MTRLNRCHPKKYDTFVLDFANKPEILKSPSPTIIAPRFCPAKPTRTNSMILWQRWRSIRYIPGDDIERLVNLYLNGADRDKLDPTLDACTAIYTRLETDDQIKFKSATKAFCRTYGFLGAILPYDNTDWERLSIFLNLLIPKLPSPREDDLSQGIHKKTV